MQANNNLSIVIPTYNRANFLDLCLEVHIPLARAYNVEIIISDNASTDETEQIVKRRIKEYSLIQYFRNNTNVGPDENFERALKYPQTDYVWLLGDSYQIPTEGIGYLLNLIENSNQKYNAIIINLANKIKDVYTQDFTDRNSLLCSLGALMTCLSCLVYSKDLIHNANFVIYRDSNFIQTGIIFEAIARQDFCIHWVQSISIQSLAHCSFKKNAWSKTSIVFEIACIKWVNFVFSLSDSYELSNKLKCIRDFTKVSGVFSLRHLLIIRSENILNYKTYKQYLYLFPLTMQYSKLTILTIALIPRFIPRCLITIIKTIKVLAKSPRNH